MTIRTLVVQCLTNKEQSVAAEILQRHGPVTTSGIYVHSVGAQADINALETKGLLVEHLPATPQLSWLDPAQQDKQAANALLTAATDQPQRSSPLQQAAAGASPVYIVQLTGPMRAVLQTHRTQTNEVARCATILPALAQLSEPLALIEVGASAGLCLLYDRWRYHYTGASVNQWIGPAESPVTLSCQLKGDVPLPIAVPTIAWRASD